MILESDDEDFFTRKLNLKHTPYTEEEKLKYALQTNNNKEDSNEDPMFEDIKRFVIKEQKAST